MGGPPDDGIAAAAAAAAIVADCCSGLALWTVPHDAVELSLIVQVTHNGIGPPDKTKSHPRPQLAAHQDQQQPADQVDQEDQASILLIIIRQHGYGDLVKHKAKTIGAIDRWARTYSVDTISAMTRPIGASVRSAKVVVLLVVVVATRRGRNLTMMTTLLPRCWEDLFERRKVYQQIHVHVQYYVPHR
jgi:hypothetical protein